MLKVYRLFAELNKIHIGLSFEDTCNHGVGLQGRGVYQGGTYQSKTEKLVPLYVNGSVFEDNTCESSGIAIQLNLYCSF
jgi:hypothetical protein